VSKGVSGQLMKATSKRRRGKEQIRQENAAEEQKKQGVAAKLA
jgi:hypothetical protein